jgi:hypothetical protein
VNDSEYLAAFLHAVTLALLFVSIVICRIKLANIDNESHNLELSVFVDFVDS